MKQVAIRQFRYPEDYSRAVHLWKAAGDGVRVGPSDAPEEVQKKLLRDPDLFLVAEAGEEMVGTVIGGFDGRRGMVYHLAVAAGFRRQGIASRLMTELEARLRSKGCIRCYLIVRLGNDGAMRHYEKLGWQRLDDDTLYAKDLAP